MPTAPATWTSRPRSCRSPARARSWAGRSSCTPRPTIAPPSPPAPPAGGWPAAWSRPAARALTEPTAGRGAAAAAAGLAALAAIAARVRHCGGDGERVPFRHRVSEPRVPPGDRAGFRWMKRPPSSRDLWASLLPTLGAVVAMAVAGRSRALADLDLLGGSWTSFGAPWWFLALLAAGAAGAFHRTFNRTTLGLGAAVVAPAVLLFGAVTAAGLAAVSLLLAEIGWRMVRSGGVVPLPERRKLLRALEAAGMAACAALAGGVLWAWLPRLRTGVELAARGAAAAAAHPVGWFG